ncbi:MAG: ABC transporter permease [Acidimicrobiales bacterium]|nr:ABC transporter permease [Acidimicrobiales bacterium]
MTLAVHLDPPAVADLARSALHPGDLLRVASVGLRTRRLRAALSALGIAIGIAIGIAAMVAVLGISESSRNDLLSSLDRLGTNLLTVRGGEGLGLSGDGALPTSAKPMLSRIGPVDGVSSVTLVDADVRRTDLIPSTRTGGLTVQATDAALLATLRGELADGEWLDDARSELPVTVLGAVTAERLGITDVGNGVAVWVGDRWFSVVGVLEPLELAPDLDRTALIGEGIAQAAFDTTENPGTIYLRADPDQIDAVRSVLPATAAPEAPDTVEVARPTDAIEAKAAASDAFTALFLGLGAVALLVGGVGIANVMVISVLERRSEIGLRRALGATRRHVSIQFLAEALLLSALGGVSGVALGAGVTAAYDLARGWAVVVPVAGVVGGVVAALLIGAVAGLYPATRAARLSPTDALRTV